MSTSLRRALSRRGVLTSGLAAAGLASISGSVLAAQSTAPPRMAMSFDGADLVVSSDGLWRRAAAGSWTRLDDPGPLAVMATHPDRPGTLLAAPAAGGLLRSVDGGKGWDSADTGLPQTAVTALTFAAHDPQLVYAALAGDGLWRSKDAGAQWEFVMDRPYLGGSEYDVLSLLSVNRATGMGGIWLYAGTGAGLTRVPDCFCRWQDVTAGDAMDALVAGKAPVAARTLPPNDPIISLGIAPAEPDLIYAGLASGVWASADAGVNWSRASGWPAHAVAVDPGNPLHLVAAAQNDLRESHDAGASWSKLNPMTEI